jgi:uncharacterized membrane protein
MPEEVPFGRGNWWKGNRTPRLLLVVLLLTSLMFIIARVIPTRGPADGWSGHGDGYVILHVFEFACLLFMLLSIAHAYRRWGGYRTLFFFTFALLYGFILEDFTVTYSGYYHYNPHSWIQIHNTMMAVPFCWTAIIYLCIYLIEENAHLRDLTKIEKGLAAGVLAVSIDVAVDAVFVAYGLWHWSEGQWFGVPLANYTAWFMAVGGFTTIWKDIDSLKAHRIVKELGLGFGMILSYGLLLVMVYLTYVATEVVFG